MPFPFSAPIQDEFPIIFGNNIKTLHCLNHTSLFSDFLLVILIMKALFSLSPLYLELFTCLIAGEWWNGDVDEVENEMMKYGGGPNSSDAYTINGLPGPFYPCSNKGIQELIFRHFFFSLFYMIALYNYAAHSIVLTKVPTRRDKNLQYSL